MKVALVTTPPTVRSGIGDYTRHLLPYLREHCEVDVFVEPGKEGEPWEGESPRSAADLRPREYDQVLYQLGNESNHGFMARMVRAIGGTVMQHDWVLFDMAVAAFPGLARGGVKGHVLALREGGVEQVKVYARNWLDRRNQRRTPEPAVDPRGLAGTLLGGWHDLEPNGRWTADCAVARIPARGVTSVWVELTTAPGRRVELESEGRSDAFRSEPDDCERRLRVELPGADEPVLRITTEGLGVTEEQRSYGDSRRLGSFVEQVGWTDGSGEHRLDLADRPRVPIRTVSLSRDRFALPLNRSVVRFADAFLVHSTYVKQRILRERNTLTPVGLVHHGAEIRWREDDRRAARARHGVPAAWRDDFLVVSFGGVQPHKRIDQVLSAVALARRERDDIRLVLAGGWKSEELDPVSIARALGIADAVYMPGFVAEETAWGLIHAGDIGVNLRGPTSGGTSGGIFQSFSLGRSVIATDAAEQSELPTACVVKVPLGSVGEGGAREAEALARELVSLRDRPERRAELERNVRAFVEEECHWRICARKYAEHLRSFPPPRVARKSLIAMRLGMGRGPDSPESGGQDDAGPTELDEPRPVRAAGRVPSGERDCATH